MSYYDDMCNCSKQSQLGGGSYPQIQFMPAMQSDMYLRPMQPDMYMQQQPFGQIPQMQMDQCLPTLPTGIPAGGLVGPVPNAPFFQGQSMSPGMDFGTPPEPTDSVQFVAGFLRTQIGKLMRVEFLIGSNGPLIDRVGTLVAVGTSYILLRPIQTTDIVMCDLYSIKFVTIITGTGASF